MVLTFDKEKMLLEAKQDIRKEIIKLEDANAEKEHIRKMVQLGMLLEIAKAGGIGYIEK